MKNLLTLGLFILFFPIHLVGQNLSEEIKFFPISQGVSQHSITSIMQDDKDFMWFGSRYGLNRYDGEQYITYESNFKGPKRALTNSYITELLADKEGNIWIGTNGGGLNYYNYKQDSFESFQHIAHDRKSISGNLVTSLFLDSENNLWVGTEKTGLNLFDKETQTFSRYYHNEVDPFSISNNDLTAINEDRLGNLWIGTWGGGLNLFDRQSNRFLHYKAGTSNNIPDNIVRHIHKGRKGTLWVGFQKGIRKIQYREGKYTFEEIKSDNPHLEAILASVPVLSIFEDSQSRLWIGTENEGLFIVYLKYGRIKQYKIEPFSNYSIVSNSIWSIYEDKAGTIWLGTFDKGVIKVDSYERKFDHLFQNNQPSKSLSHNVVSCFAEDELGNLWIGTDGGGLNYFDQSTGEFTHYTKENTPGLLSNAILALLLDSKGNLWIGSWEGGLSIKKKGSATITHLTSIPQHQHAPPGNFIFSIHEDSKNRIWIGAYRHGLSLYVPEENLFYEFKEKGFPRAISHNNVHVAYESQGYIWIGTEGGGLDKIKINDQYEVVELTNYNHDAPDSLKIGNNHITVIFSDSKDNLWIGTHGGGLNKFNSATNRFEVISTDNGLPSNLIYAIEEDSGGHLWISTNKGLAEYDPQNQTVVTYDEADGLQSSMFYLRASYKKKDGELLFGGINGINRFYPNAILRNPNIPQVYITGMSVSNNILKPDLKGYLKENIILTDEINLPYHESDFNITFSSLNFSQSSKNQYMYKLENHDEHWQEVGTRNSAYYTNVLPGSYTFKVKASNNDNVWNEHEATLKINIGKPWWGTAWAYLFYCAIIFSILWWGRSITLKREKLKNKLEVEHLELKKMQELDEIKSRFFANISHEFRTPLTLILGPLRAMNLEEKWVSYHSQIHLMIKNAEKLLRLINQLLDLSKIESGRMKLRASEYNLIKFLKPIAHSFSGYAEKEYIRYKINLPEKPLRIYFEKEKLEKVLTNILSNAFKYTPRFGTVSLSIEQKNQEVIISIQDSGIGISKDEVDLIFKRYYQVNPKKGKQNIGTGIGLALSKELIELHKGHITVSSQEGKGSLFQISLPKGKAHLKEDEIVPLKKDFVVIDEEKISNDYLQPIEEEKEIAYKSVFKRDHHLPVILIVEDNTDIRSFIFEHLKDKFSILEATNGKMGYEIAIDQKPDVIISDIVMPEMDGYMLCQYLKNNPETCHIPVILLTAKASNNSQKKGFELGADYFVAKPFDIKQLTLRLNNILKSREIFKDQVLNNKTLNLSPQNLSIPNADDTFIKNIIVLIEENIADPTYNVNDLCKELGLSRIQLYRKLKKMIGQSANELMRSVRLKRAAQLLKQQKLTIAEITYQVGFNDLQYFRKCFKKQYGVNPSEYVSNHQEKRKQL